MRQGPMVTLKASCSGCAHVQEERYRVQGDSGCDVYCAHPDVTATSKLGSRGSVGDTTWNTPRWCPLLEAALVAVRSAL